VVDLLLAHHRSAARAIVVPARAHGDAPRHHPPQGVAAGHAPSTPDEKPREVRVIQTKLFVGNLTFDTTSEQLRELFAPLGEVVSVTVPTDRDTGRPRGFAFVELSTPEQAAAATQRLNGYELDGRALRVNEATERPAGPSFRPGGFGADVPVFRARPKGSRRNLRARRRGFR
jgi:cold-inducible RNA-binding protein